MPKVEIEKTIDAPREKLWGFISDIKAAPVWIIVMQSLVETTENPLQKDSAYREQSRIGPKESVTEWRVTRFDAPQIQVHEYRAHDFEATLPCGLKMMEMEEASFTTQRSIALAYIQTTRLAGRNIIYQKTDV